MLLLGSPPSLCRLPRLVLARSRARSTAISQGVYVPATLRPDATPDEAPSRTAGDDNVSGVLKRFGVQRVRPWLAHALAAAGFERPSAIQAAAMPAIARHADVVVHSATGSGKTLSFLVPLLSRLEPGVPMQLLLLSPSRELALQTAATVERLVGAPDGGGGRGGSGSGGSGSGGDGSGLHVELLVGGLSSAPPPPSSSTASVSSSASTAAALQLHRQLSLAVQAPHTDQQPAPPLLPSRPGQPP